MEPPKKRRFLGASGEAALGNGLLLMATASVGPKTFLKNRSGESEELLLLGCGGGGESVQPQFLSGGRESLHLRPDGDRRESLQQDLSTRRRELLQQQHAVTGESVHQHLVSGGDSLQQQHLVSSGEPPQHHLVSNSGVGSDIAVATAQRRNRRKYSLEFKVSVLGRIINTYGIM